MANTIRYLALDVLRGLTIAGMILVNTPGSWSHMYAPLRHAAWHGCTIADLVFPFFLFVMGVSMYFSFTKYQHGLNAVSLTKIGKRTLLIFAIGLFLNTFPQWLIDYSGVRIMGVLQRIALVYFISALLVLSVGKRTLRFLPFLIVLVYWGALWLFGGDNPYSLEGNMTIPVDVWLLGEAHVYKGFGIPFDPEGIVSTIPAVATALLGYWAGFTIKKTNKTQLPLKFFMQGFVLAGIGWLWSLWLPMNKPLWTGSYVLFTVGLALVLLALFIWIIDIRQFKKWTVAFTVFGMNPLFIFSLSVVWVKCLIYFVSVAGVDGKSINGYRMLYQFVFVPLAGELHGSFLFALSHIALFWLVGWVLYKRKIFIKV
jgi:predicted acyltransferase